MQNARKIIFLQFSLDFISGAFLIISSWTIFASTGNSTITGFYISTGFLPSLLANIYIGAIVDRWDARRMMQLSLVMMLCSLILMIFGFTFDALWILFITQMFMQLAGSIFRPSVQVYMTHLYPPEQLKYLFTKSASISILGGVVGTFVASQFIIWSKIYISLLLIVLMILITILSAKFPVLTFKKEIRTTSIHRDIFEGLQYIKTKPIFWKLFLLLGSGQIITHCTTGFLAAYTYEIFTNDSAIYGYLQISLTAGGILLGFFTKNLLTKIEQHFSHVAFILLCACLTICIFSTNFVLICCSLFMIGLFTTWIRSHYQAIQQIHTDSHFNGKMASFRMIINQGSVVIISPLLGIIGSTFGIHMIFSVLAIVAIIAFMVSMKLNKMVV